MKNSKSILNIPIFLFAPFLGFILSLRDLKSRSNILIFISFCVIFGYAFVLQNTSADSYRIGLTFNEHEIIPLSETYKLYLNGVYVDLYRYFSYSFVKSFTTNPKILFAYFGLVFGIFWYLSIRLFLNEKGENWDRNILILFIVFLISNSVININSPRFNTAIWVFFYGTYNVVIQNKKRYIWLILCAPLVHFSFLSAVIATFLFLLFKKIILLNGKINVLLYYLFVFLFCLSFILDTNIIKLDFLSRLIPSSGIADKLEFYNSNDLANLYEDRAADSLFLKVSHSFLLVIKLYVFVVISAIWKHVKKMEIPDNGLNTFLAFVMSFLCFGFVVSSVPSGVRFLIVGYIFTTLFMLRFYLLHPSLGFKRKIKWLVPLYSFKFLYGIGYLGIILASKTLWYGNIFWIIYEGLDYRFINLT